MHTVGTLHNDERSFQKLTPSAQKYGSNLEKRIILPQGLPVLWIGIVFTTIRIRIRISSLMLIQTRILIASNDDGPNADPTLSFTHVGKLLVTLFPVSSVFISLISVKDVITGQYVETC